MFPGCRAKTGATCLIWQPFPVPSRIIYGGTMFARVSTYRTSADATGAPTEETIKRVLELPGCLGLYYLKGRDNKSLSISLWDTEEDLGGSQQQANKIRSETSKEQHMEVLEVEEFEVLTNQLKDWEVH
jgi:hypothetical protein